MSRRTRTTDIKLLWCRSGGRCAICRRELSVMDSGGVIGEMAHIIAAKPDGPRGDSSACTKKLGQYDNLVLLCPNHHTEVDSEPDKWSPERLRAIKRRHEQWVRSTLTARLAANAIAGNKCLFIISGPPGSGKDVIINRLIHRLESRGRPATSLRRYTTRCARPGEVAGTPFTYLNPEEFSQRVGRGEIGCVHTSMGHTYGCDPDFSEEAPRECAIFYSMRVYSVLSMIKDTAERRGVHVRNILLLGDADSFISRVLMRSVSEAEKSARIDETLQDLLWLEEHSDYVQQFFNLVIDNSDMARIREVVTRLDHFVDTTLAEISEVSQYINGGTI